LRPAGIGGPVGFVHALLGFTSGVVVARVWEYFAKEAHCVPACPSLGSELFLLHHFYFGLGIIIPSLLVLGVAVRQRLRWDADLLLGIGIGLSADEVGLLFLGVPYGSLVSLLVPLGVGIGLLVGAANAIRRDDAHEFLVLDRNDVLTIAGVLLSLVGVLYLDRPLNQMVEFTATASLSLAVLLFALFGKKHFARIIR